MQKVRPKKSLGQHFLNDEDIARRIAQTMEPHRELPLLEVGPGMGVLTRYLLEQGHDLRVVELDSESVRYLQAAFPALDGRIIEADFLKMNLHETYGDAPFAIIGNYPYNISSQIFFKVLEMKDQVLCCSGMLQREVAQRIAAPPGNRQRGILSVLLQAWYDIEYLFSVPPSVFTPPPKVHSGVIRLTRNTVTDLGCDWKLMRTVVKTAFGQRRKTMRNSLRGLLPPQSPALATDVFNSRPEQLSVDQFIALTNLIATARGTTAES